MLMQLKMVLEDIIAYMYKVIRELWLFRHSPKPELPLRFPNVKSFITLPPVNCAMLVYITSKYSARQDLGG